MRFGGIEGFNNSLFIDIGIEKSNDQVFESNIEYRFDFNFSKTTSFFLVLNYDHSYEESANNKNLITNKGFGHARTTKELNKDLSVEVFLQYGFNDFLLMKQRRLFGSGLRYHFFDKKSHDIYVGSGAMKEIEKYDTVSNDYKNLLRSTNYITYELKISSKASLSTTSYYQMDFSTKEDYRILLDSSFQYKLSEQFAIQLEYNYRYDSDPHGELGKTYVQIKNGFELIF
tara:strand:+ start:2258 stop:2944 length:687 start_codon:yes stop_codon:yes gene_type:complete